MGSGSVSYTHLDVYKRQQGRIGEQTGVDVVGVFSGFVLKLGHTGQLAELGVAVEHPCQLCVGADMALNEGDALIRVDAAGKHQRVGGQGVAFQLLRVLAHGDGVLVDDAVCAVIFVLKQTPVFNSAQIVAQGESTAGRLDAGEDDLFAFRFVFGDVQDVYKRQR